MFENPTCGPRFVDMTGIIPEEDEEEQEMYDDVGHMDDIYEELPGPTVLLIHLLICYSMISDELPSISPNLFTTLPSFNISAPRGRNARACEAYSEGGPREQACAPTPRYTALKRVSAIESV